MTCYPKQFYDPRLHLALLTSRCYRRFSFFTVCSKRKIKDVGEAFNGIMLYEVLYKSVNSFFNFKGDGHIETTSCA